MPLISGPTVAPIGHGAQPPAPAASPTNPLGPLPQALPAAQESLGDRQVKKGWGDWAKDRIAGLAQTVGGRALDTDYAEGVLNRFAIETLTPSVKKNRTYLRDLTGSDELNNIIAGLALRNVAKPLAEEIKGQLPDGLLLKHWELFNLTVEANLFQWVVNVVEEAKRRDATFPARMEPADLMIKVMALVTHLETAEVKKLSAEMQRIEQEAITRDQRELKKRQLFDQMAKSFLAAALPKGKEDLILPSIPYVPLEPVKWYAYRKLQQVVPGLMGDLFLKLWTFTQVDHPRNMALVVGRPDGADVVKGVEKLATKVPPFVDALAKEGVSDLTERKVHPALKQWLGKVLEKVGDAATVRPLLDQLSRYSYPVMMHVLARLVEAAEREGADKTQPVMTTVVNSLFDSLINFVKRHDREQLVRDLAAYRAGTLPQHPFSALADEILYKAGLDEAGLASPLPLKQKAVAGMIKTALLEGCTDLFEAMIVPQGKPLAIAGRLSGYEEGRRVLEGTAGEMVAKISESLVEWLGEQPPEEAWMAPQLKEWLAKSPHRTYVEQFLKGYLVDGITDLMAYLAVSYPPVAGQAKIDMPASASAHLVTIVASEVKDPKWVEKLKQWMALPEANEEQKRAKALEKGRLQAQLFGPCANKIVEKAGWDKLENIRAPKMWRAKLKTLVAEKVLPEQLFRIGCDMVVPKSFSPVDVRRLEKMGGMKELELLCDGLAEKGLPGIRSKMREHADLMAAKVNEKQAQDKLELEDEVWLGATFQGLLQDGQTQLKPFWSTAERLLSQGLRYGLAQLALNYKGPNQGDLAGNIALYLRDMVKHYVFDPRLAEKIRIYHEQTAPLKVLDKQISALRKEALSEHPKVNAVRKQKLKQLKAERAQKEKELEEKYQIKATHKELLKAFEGDVKKLMADMGFATAQDLPVPYFMKKMLWKNLTTDILPDLCLTATEKLIAGMDSLMPDTSGLEGYEKKLNARYEKNLPAGIKLPMGAKAPLVAGVYKLADHLVKVIESQVALHGAEGARKAIDGMVVPALYGGEKARLAVAKVVDENKEEIVRWIGEESPEMVAIARERMGKALRQVIAEPLLKGVTHFIEHLEGLESQHPELLFDFVFQVAPLVSDHLALATEIAKKQGKTYIHEVDPLIMVREFESHGKLHAAMPGWKEQQALKEEDRYIQQLEEQVKKHKRQACPANWYLQVDRLKILNKAPQAIQDQLANGPEYYLREAKENRDLLQKKIEAKMREHFYDDFSKHLMQMAGLQGANDLPGGEAFWSLIGMTKTEGWEHFNKAVPWLLMEGVQAAFAPRQLNSYMATLLRALNENLRKKRLKGEIPPEITQPLKAADSKDREMQERCKRMIEEMKKVMPGSIIQEFTELPLIDKIPGKILAQALREALQQNPLSKVVEVGLVAAIDKLPEKLPKSFEELEAMKKQRESENVRNLMIIRAEGEKTFPRLFERMEQNLLAWWKRKQDEFDKWIMAVVGPDGIKVKEFFDKIFRFVFISLVMGPTYKCARWILSFGIDWYARRVGRFVELGRASLVETPINANLLLHIGDKFKEIYR